MVEAATVSNPFPGWDGSIAGARALQAQLAAGVRLDDDFHDPPRTVVGLYVGFVDGGYTVRAAAVLLRRTVEEHLYWALVHARWVLPEGYAATRAIIAPHLPKLVGGLVLDRAVRPALRKQFEMQGLGKHGDEDVARRGAEDLAALAGWLGDRNYFLGDEPRSVDATVFAMLLAIDNTAGDPPLTTALRRHGNLRAYVERVYERCFSDRPPGQGGA